LVREEQNDAWMLLFTGSRAAFPVVSLLTHRCMQCRQERVDWVKRPSLPNQRSLVFCGIGPDRATLPAVNETREPLNCGHCQGKPSEGNCPARCYHLPVH
jgi:hypothetical protein